MAKRSAAPDMIEEFEGAAERMAHWIGEHLWPVAGTLVVVLAAAGAIGGYSTWSRSREEAASNALDQARAAYLRDLGAPAGALEEPALANPAAATAIREEALGRFEAVAADHPGTVAGTLALLESATLLDKLGRGEEATETLQQALDRAAGNPGLEGLLQRRMAETYEARGAWAEAAAAYEAAGRLADFPLRYWALADAARCYAAAGDPDRALALYEQVEQEAPQLNLPPHMRLQLRELRATRSASGAPSQMSDKMDSVK